MSETPEKQNPVDATEAAREAEEKALKIWEKWRSEWQEIPNPKDSRSPFYTYDGPNLRVMIFETEDVQGVRQRHVNKKLEGGTGSQDRSTVRTFTLTSNAAERRTRAEGNAAFVRMVNGIESEINAHRRSGIDVVGDQLRALTEWISKLVDGVLIRRYRRKKD